MNMQLLPVSGEKLLFKRLIIGARRRPGPSVLFLSLAAKIITYINTVLAHDALV